MKKRLLAMIMAFVMAMSLLPMSALAGGTTTPETINVNIYNTTDGKSPMDEETINESNLTATIQTLTCGRVYEIDRGQLYELDFSNAENWKFDDDGIKKLVVFQEGTEESEIRQVLGPSAKIEDYNKIFNNKKLHADTVFYQEFDDDNDDNEWECVVYNTKHGWLDTSQTKHALFGTWSLSCTVNGATALKVSKTLDGREWQADDAFTFRIAAVTEGAPMPVSKTITLTKDKTSGAFGDITFTKAGTYVYTVTEDATTIGGVTKDSTVYTVTVTVTDNSAGQLVAAVSYEIGDTDYTYGANGMTFTNTYRASSVVVPGGDSAGKDDGKLEITKSLSGREWQADDAFTFRIAAVTEGAPMPVSKTITLTKDKTSGTFGDITFTQAGVYEYTITETKGTISNVTYDTTVYTVKVTVTDGGNGLLSAAVEYTSSTGEFDYTAKDGMTFTNTYTKPVKPHKPPVLNKEDHYAYVVGYPDGTVKPQGNITRAEVATIFFRMLTDDSRNEFWSQTNSYSDVSEGQWFNNAISTLANAGILSGYPDGTFRPNAPITRAEFTKIAASFFEQVEYTIDNPFNDVDDDDWFYKFVMAAYEDGLITGYPEGDFRPNANINRAEAMTIVNRTLGRAPDADHFLKDMIVWPDNPKSAWYYEAVQEATNSHEYVMKGTGTNQYEEWTKILEVRDWPALEKEWSDANSAAGGEVVK